MLVKLDLTADFEMSLKICLLDADGELDDVKNGIDDSGKLQKILEADHHREMVYFDETLVGYLVVQKQPEHLVSQLSVDLLVQGGEGNATGLSGVVLGKPLLEKEDLEVYKFSSYLTYPKIKLNDNPQLLIRCRGTLRLKHQDSSESSDILQDFVPAQRRNILSEIKPTVVAGKNKFLMEDSVLPDLYIKDNKVELEIENNVLRPTSPEIFQLSQNISLPIIKTLSIRVRNIKIKETSILSTIDVELSSKIKNLGLPIELKSITYKKYTGSCIPKFTTKLPLLISQNDSFSFVHQLDSHEPVNYKVLIDIDSAVTGHEIKTKFISNIEFISPSSVKRRSASSLNLSSGPPPAQTLSQGLSITFIGNKKVKLGEVFKLKAHILNNSKKNRNLVMVFNYTSESYQPSLPKIKSHIQTNLTLLKHYTSSKIRTVGILSLINEVHFKVNVDQVFETDVVFMGLEAGIFNLSGVKLVDLTSGENMSCDKLLQIVVTE